MISVDLRQLTAFVTVADQSSFTRAAALLGYAQSSVTAQIKGLEEELGIPLFERLGKRVSLTRAGQRLMPQALQMLRLAEEIRRSVPDGEQPSGPLTIGAAETLCTYALPELLGRYRGRYPAVQIILQPGICDHVRKGIRENELDLGLILDDVTDLPGLHTEVLRPEPISLVAPPGHPLTRLRQVLPGDLRGEGMLFTEPCGYRTLFERILAAEQIKLGSVQEFGSIEAIKRCVSAGLGLAVLPRLTVERELQRGELRALPWAGSPVRVFTQLVYHKDKWPSPALKAFLELLRSSLGTGIHGLQAQLDLLPGAEHA